MSNETEAGRQEARLEPLVGREHLPALVDAFLAWPLPESVCSDGCVTARGAPHRTGTNLLTADEARQMFEHVLDAASADPKCRICDNTGWNHYAQPGPGPGYKTVRCKCAIGTPNAELTGAPPLARPVERPVRAAPHDDVQEPAPSATGLQGHGQTVASADGPDRR